MVMLFVACACLLTLPILTIQHARPRLRQHERQLEIQNMSVSYVISRSVFIDHQVPAHNQTD